MAQAKSTVRAKIMAKVKIMARVKIMVRAQLWPGENYCEDDNSGAGENYSPGENNGPGKNLIEIIKFYYIGFRQIWGSFLTKLNKKKTLFYCPSANLGLIFNKIE